MARQRRHKAHEEEEHENEERWLVSYADMMTLLFALFMVLFSISSVNISKYRTLQKALQAAFSGNILPGGRAIAQPGATANSSRAPTAADVPAIVPPTSSATEPSSVKGAANGATASLAQAQQEQSDFERLKHQLDTYAQRHGFAKEVSTSVQGRGLVIRVLTDRLLFASGSATLMPVAQPLLGEIGALVNLDRTHPVAVEGNTDDVPIHGGAFPSNWELSTARASMVVRFLIARGVHAPRLSASGYADLRPLDSNATAQGRARNRRVEIVLQRLYGPASAGQSLVASASAGEANGEGRGTGSGAEPQPTPEGAQGH